MKLYETLIRSAKKEILVIFPTANNFLLNREQPSITMSLLEEANKHIYHSNNNTQIKVLTPYQRIKEIIQESNKNKQQQMQQHRHGPSDPAMAQQQLNISQSIITTRYIEPHLQTKVLLLVVDKQYSLAVELKDEANREVEEENFSFYDSIGLATYSNNKPTVLSFVSIFEALWNQVELDEKLKESYKLLELANEQLKLNDIMQKEFIGIAAH